MAGEFSLETGEYTITKPVPSTQIVQTIQPTQPTEQYVGYQKETVGGKVVRYYKESEYIKERGRQPEKFISEEIIMSGGKPVKRTIYRAQKLSLIHI